MNPLPASQTPDASRRSWIPTAIILGLALVIVLGWWLPRLSPLPIPLPELNRTNLWRQDDRWFQVGHTNPFTGIMTEFYPDGAPLSRSVVSNGLLNGLSEGWFTNRQIQIRETYHANLSDGLRTKWYPSGNKLSEATIVKGKIQGIYRHWHEDGNLAEEIPMVDGQIEGTGRTYYESGFIKTEVRMHAGKVIEQSTWPDGKRTRPESKAKP